MLFCFFSAWPASKDLSFLRYFLLLLSSFVSQISDIVFLINFRAYLDKLVNVFALLIFQDSKELLHNEYSVLCFRALFRCRPMPVHGLSLLGLKRIRGFVSILRYINPTIIIIHKPHPIVNPTSKLGFYVLFNNQGHIGIGPK